MFLNTAFCRFYHVHHRVLSYLYSEKPPGTPPIKILNLYEPAVRPRTTVNYVDWNRHPIVVSYSGITV